MHAFSKLLLWFATMAVILGCGIACTAQNPRPSRQSAAIAVSISLKANKVPSDQSPVVVLQLQNLTDQHLPLHTDPHMYRVQVRREKGDEPPTTALQRRITGKLLPGEAEQRSGGV